MNKLVFAAVLVLLSVLIMGCTNQNSAQTTPQATLATPQTTQSSGTVASGCTSPYDGTYSGTVSGSGEASHPNVNGQSVADTPYIYSYNLELTVQCVSLPGSNQVYDLPITHVKVSDPFFDCTNGCAPDNSGTGTSFQLLPPGEKSKDNSIMIIFPNQKWLLIGPVFADPDAKRISADQSDKNDLIHSTLGFDPNAPTGGTIRIENGICQNCWHFDQEGLTMTLDKIS